MENKIIKELDYNSNTCYRCSKFPTSKEHVPPVCLFPEKKDNPTKDFRRNLITVPSCKKHNSKKSNNDEFLLVCLASSIQTNNHGYKHYSTKIKRTLTRSNYKFLDKIIKDYSELNIVDEQGQNMKVLKGKADIERLNDCFKSIMYGLYYQQFNSRFIGEIKLYNNFVIPETTNQMSLIKLIERTFENDKKLTPILGENPEIFTYQFAEKDNFGIYGLKITFYEGIYVFGALMPKESKEPRNFAMDLIGEGLKVRFNFGDETIAFNEDE